MRSMSKTLFLVALISLFSLYYLVPLEFRALWQPDETRYAEISREMLANGSWVTPHFFDLRYFEKPIAGYWINTLSQWLFGHNNFSVRMGSVFSTTASALMLFWLGKRLFIERSVALTGIVIFLTSLLVYGVGTYTVLDPMLALWMTGAMCSYWLAAEARTPGQRLRGYLLLGCACGMGFMTKGFLALALPVLAILPWAIWRGRFTELLRYGPLTVIIAVLISAPWALAIHRQQPDFWHYFFWTEHIQRFADADAQHKAPFWYYLPILLAGSLPWLALLPGALQSGWKRRHDSSGSLYLLSWVVMPLLFFSIAKGKLPTYILPCFSPLALLMAHYGCALAKQGSRVLAVNAGINILFGSLTTLALLTVFAPWGLSHHPLYNENEHIKLTLAVIAFAGWAVAGTLSLCRARNMWTGAALCPLALALCIGPALPERLQNTKQPQLFIHDIAGKLSSSRYVLTDNVGVASAIAWTLKRSDLLFYDQQGELHYGLSYEDAHSRFIPEEEFGQWLAQHRKSGNISLVLMIDGNETLPAAFNEADYVRRRGRMLFVYYRSLPEQQYSAGHAD